MTLENRYEYLIELVTRISRIATRIVPDDMAGEQLGIDPASQRNPAGVERD
jgi:hypothetical protein